jgi:hypothetical protein
VSRLERSLLSPEWKQPEKFSRATEQGLSGCPTFICTSPYKRGSRCSFEHPSVILSSDFLLLFHLKIIMEVKNWMTNITRRIFGNLTHSNLCLLHLLTAFFLFMTWILLILACWMIMLVIMEDFILLFSIIPCHLKYFRQNYK